MQGFAQRGALSNRPGSSRQQIAANAKVQVAPTHRDPVQQRRQPAQQNVHQPMRRQSGGRHNDVAFPPQQPQPRSQVPVKDDPYDTDVQSLDTTIPRGSVYQQVQDSQQTQPLHGHQHNGDDPYDEYEEGSEDEDDDEGEGDGDDEVDEENHETGVRELTQKERDYLQSLDLGHLNRERSLEFLARVAQDTGLAWDDGHSYPTTTSGPPDNFPDKYEAEGDAASDDYAESGHVSPSPRPGVKGQPVRQAPDLQFQRHSTTAHSANTMAGRPPIFQTAAAVREQHRSNINADRGHAASSGHNAIVPERKQPPTQNQSIVPPGGTRSGKTNVHNGAVAQNMEALPQRGARAQASAQGPIQRQSRIEPTPQGSQAAPVKIPVHIKAPTPEPLEEELIVESPTRKPAEDYSRDELIKMRYDQLKDQDFDTNPRAEPSVLSDDMQLNPLEERLEHVQRSLNEDDQAKFLSSLPTTEWEEAGDWFLSQFAGIIQRTKEARQTKRKLAREFEDEVEKRHKHVSKKRSGVEVALSKMRNQGQGLIPKSPAKAPKIRKSSKSPARV